MSFKIFTQIPIMQDMFFHMLIFFFYNRKMSDNNENIKGYYNTNVGIAFRYFLVIKFTL